MDGVRRSPRTPGWSAARVLVGSIASVVCLLTCLIARASADQPAAPQRSWLRLQTSNFTLLGNSSEKDLRRVGQRLEQFREAIGILFPKAVLNAPRPTIVLVFKNREGVRPVQAAIPGQGQGHRWVLHPRSGGKLHRPHD